MTNPSMIRSCTDTDFDAILAIINEAAEAYRGIIPADRWHEPYMPAEELRHEIAAGVVFWGWEEAGQLVGVMGIQDVQDVTLIRHAYIRTACRNHGIGGKLGMTTVSSVAIDPMNSEDSQIRSSSWSTLLFGFFSQSKMLMVLSVNYQ